jgi:hypothetical protein
MVSFDEMFLNDYQTSIKKWKKVETIYKNVLEISLTNVIYKTIV